ERRLGDFGNRRILRRRSAGRARLYYRGKLLHRPHLRRIERRPGAEIVDDRLQGLNLRREFAGGGAIAAVLHLERGIGAAHLIELGLRAPSRPQTHQYRESDDRNDRNDCRTKTDREAPDDATRAISNDNCISTRLHSSCVKELSTVSACAIRG